MERSVGAAVIASLVLAAGLAGCGGSGSASTARTARTPTTAADRALTEFRRETAGLPASRREIALKQWEIVRSTARGGRCPTAAEVAQLTARVNAAGEGQGVAKVFVLGCRAHRQKA